MPRSANHQGISQASDELILVDPRLPQNLPHGIASDDIVECDDDDLPALLILQLPMTTSLADDRPRESRHGPQESTAVDLPREAAHSEVHRDELDLHRLARWPSSGAGRLLLEIPRDPLLGQLHHLFLRIRSAKTGSPGTVAV